MIINANQFNLNQISPNLPQLSETVNNWFQNITLYLIAKTVPNFKVLETPTKISFQGNWQFVPAEALKIENMGERSWKYAKLWTQIGVAITTDDIIQYQGTNFRIIEKIDWTSSGYIEFSLVQDFTNVVSGV